MKQENCCCNDEDSKCECDKHSKESECCHDDECESGKGHECCHDDECECSKEGKDGCGCGHHHDHEERKIELTDANTGDKIEATVLFSTEIAERQFVYLSILEKNGEEIVCPFEINKDDELVAINLDEDELKEEIVDVFDQWNQAE